MIKGEDGVYRWNYELNMFHNASILFLLFKVFLIACGGVCLFVTIISIGDIAFSLGKIIKEFLLVYLILCVLAILGYLVYALIFKGKYCVVFEMDEKGIKHIQIDSQFEKSQIMDAIVAIGGAAAGNVTTAGIGLNAMSRNSSYSDFSKVKRINPYSNQNMIELIQPFGNNQIYVSDEDFDFVLNHIRSHCPDAEKKGEI